jgi:hypothetical protein
MNTPMKLGAYAAGLAVIFAGAFGIGTAVGDVAPAPVTDGHGAHASQASDQPGAGHGAPTEPASSQTSSALIPGGLQVSQNGYTLTPSTTALTPGETTDLRFNVTGPDGAPVTAYQVQHDKKLHLIVVSRDLADFQHLHPDLSADGTWNVKLALPQAGAYRMYADFAPEDGSGMTLGADLYAAGDYEPKKLPEAGRTSTVDGYTVTLDGDLIPGKSSKLTLKVSKDGHPVTDLQPYLGAYGHLVALRAGDLAYLHVHPDGRPGDGRTPSGPEITFYAQVPSRGDYRLFLDFRHEGDVRTADFTARAGESPAPATTLSPRPTATPSTSDSHGDHDH